MNVPINELYWIAGFLEGEGCFYRNMRGTIGITVSQVQREPLARLCNLLNGKIHQYSQTSIKQHIYYRWQIYGLKAEEIMKAVFPLMSPKRQAQISVCLSWYASRPGVNFKKNGRKYCRSGLHTWIPENIIVDACGGRSCKICKSDWQRNRRETIKLSRLTTLQLN